jgi:FHS family L-fucose permease-like MFS transporter
MFVAQHFILSALWSDDKNESGELIYSTLQGAEKASWKAHDLMVIRDPYVVLGLVVIAMLLVILFYKMPKSQQSGQGLNFTDSLRLLLKNPRYKGGVLTQVFYVAAQIMCWTFIIHYAENIGIPFEKAQIYNMVAMGMFIAGRFISTFVMKFVQPARLLMLFAIGGILTTLGVIFIGGHTGLLCLVSTSIFMSLMFPTIYGIALRDMGEESKLGAAGLVMAIVGGALMPFLQGKFLDIGGKGLDDVLILGVPEVNFSFILPLICFMVISIYGYVVQKHQQ